MSIELAKEPLQITEDFCTVDKVQGEATNTVLEDWIKTYFSENASLVIWHIHTVVWGVIRGGVLQFADNGKLDADTILEARIFDKESELHIVRNGDVFVGRYIADKGEQRMKHVDSFGRLWGENAGRAGEFVALKDVNRKLALSVPCKEDAAYYGLVTRNYIGHAEQNGQAGYIDYRYVQITSAEGGR